MKSLPFHISEAWKRYPLRAEPPRIGHYREYPPPRGVCRSLLWNSYLERTAVVLHYQNETFHTSVILRFWLVEKELVSLAQPFKRNNESHRDPLAPFFTFSASYTYFHRLVHWIVTIFPDWLELWLWLIDTQTRLFILCGKSVKSTLAFFLFQLGYICNVLSG